MFGNNPFSEYRATQQQVQEAVKYPHMMYDPKTGKEFEAKTPADHAKYAKMGYTHDKPKMESVQEKTVDEAAFTKKAVETGKVKTGPSKDRMAAMQKQYDDKKKNEATQYVIPEEIPANERTAFHGAAAAAAKSGKKSFNFGGKTHPVTMKKDTAKAIADDNVKEGMYKDMDTEKSEPSPRSDAKVKADMKKRRKTEKSDVDMNPKLDKGTKDNSMEQKESLAMDEGKYVGGPAYTHPQHIGTNNGPTAKKIKVALTKAGHSFRDHGDVPGNKASNKHYISMKDKEGHAALQDLKKKHMKESTGIRAKLMSVLSEKNDREKHYKGATKPETMDDKLSGKGAKDMMEPAKNAKVDDTEEKGHIDAVKAGKTGPQAKARSGGDNTRNGDQKIKPSATPVKGAMYKTMEAYASMNQKDEENGD